MTDAPTLDDVEREAALDRLAAAERVVEAAREWQRTHPLDGTWFPYDGSIAERQLRAALAAYDAAKVAQGHGPAAEENGDV